MSFFEGLPSVDLLIKGGHVVTGNGQFFGDVAVKDGRVAAMGHLSYVRALRQIDAQGCYVMPGLVDMHVHMQCAAWNAVSPNDFYRGTRAAALGGVTTIVDFATQRRGHSLMEAVQALREQADGQVVIDYGLHMSIADASPSTLSEIRQVIQYGIPTFKMFMTYRSHELMLEDGDILEILQRVTECGGLAGVHAENASISERNYAHFEARGLRMPSYHALAKPAYVEVEALSRALFLARVVGAPLLIYHLSTAWGREVVRQARAGGQRVIAETCIHYLCFTKDLLDEPDGIKWICSPPLRDQADVEALWLGLQDGTIAAVSTDEAGFNLADKMRAAEGPLDQVPNGLPGIEFRLPVLFTKGVMAKRLSVQRFVELNCTNPARICGLYPRKGVIFPGSDADLIIVDPAHRVKLGVATQHLPVDWCPYEGMEVYGYPKYTIARGEVIVDNYVFCGERGRGKFVPGEFDVAEPAWLLVN